MQTSTLPRIPAVVVQGRAPFDAARCSLMAVLAVGAMIPWYTLRLLPVAMFGSAKVNPLDVLVACAFLLAVPAIARGILGGERALLWVCAFLAYMAVPFLAGLRDPNAAFYAVREARALTFYTLALAFVAGGYRTRDFRDFAAVYVAGAAAAAVLVFGHLLWRAPLPGYPAVIGTTPSEQAGVLARYLDWTVPVMAFTLSLAGVLTAASRRARAGWGIALLVIVWYLIAMHERTTQGIALGVAVALITLPQMGGLRPRRAAFLAVALGILVSIGVGLLPGPRWISEPIRHSLDYWSQVGNDPSVQARIKELRHAIPKFEDHPLFGGGLGAIVNDVPPEYSGGPWRYTASGYAFLLVKAGLVGFVLYLGMVGFALRRAWAALRQGKAAEGWPRAAIGLVGLVALLVLNLAHPTVDVPEGVIAFSLVFGMLVSREDSGPGNV